MTPEARAAAVVEIATSLRGRLYGDIIQRTTDPVERNELLAGVLALVTRRVIRDIPLPVDRELWLAEIVKAAVL